MCLHFQNIILPEAIQTALEPSVIEMVAKLDRIIARCGVPLEKLMSDLDANITNLILKSQVSVENIFSLLLNVYIIIILMYHMSISTILLQLR